MSDPAAVPASLPTTAAGVRVERVVTSGVFELDGGSWEVENNVWIVGDDHECVVIDCAHDAAAILAAVGARTVLALLCTHAHNDHVNAAPAVREATGAPTILHPADRVLWDATLSFPPDLDLADGASIVVGDLSLSVLHTPGHAPGACCFFAPSLGVLFSGDTLFNGGPGATGRSWSDYPTIINSIRAALLTLPPDTVVLTGHGDATTIGAEAANFPTSPESTPR